MEDTSFQQSFTELLEFAKKILKGSSSTRFLSETKQYERLFEKTSETDAQLDKHKKLFAPAMRSCMKHVDDIDGFMEWFYTDAPAFVIRPSEKSKCQVRLNVIFRHCVRLAKDVPEDSDDKASLYPECFMVYLFRIFSCIDEDERVADTLKELESILDPSDLSPDDATDSIFGVVQNIANDMGIEGSGDVSSSDFKKAITDFQQSEFKDKLVNMFKGVDFSSGDGLQQLVTSFTDQMKENAEAEPPAITRSKNIE